MKRTYKTKNQLVLSLLAAATASTAVPAASAVSTFAKETLPLEAEVMTANEGIDTQMVVATANTSLEGMLKSDLHFEMPQALEEIYADAASTRETKTMTWNIDVNLDMNSLFGQVKPAFDSLVSSWNNAALWPVEARNKTYLEINLQVALPQDITFTGDNHAVNDTTTNQLGWGDYASGRLIDKYEITYAEDGKTANIKLKLGYIRYGDLLDAAANGTLGNLDILFPVSAPVKSETIKPEEAKVTINGTCDTAYHKAGGIFHLEVPVNIAGTEVAAYSYSGSLPGEGQPDDGNKPEVTPPNVLNGTLKMPTALNIGDAGSGKVYETEIGKAFPMTGSVNITNIRNEFNRVVNDAFEDAKNDGTVQDLNEFMNQVTFEELNFEMAAVFQLDSRVNVPVTALFENGDVPEGVTFTGGEGFVLKSLKEDGNKLTATFALKDDIKTLADLNEVAESTKDVMSLTIDGFEIASFAEVGDVLNVTGTVGGTLDAKASIPGNTSGFFTPSYAFVLEAAATEQIKVVKKDTPSKPDTPSNPSNPSKPVKPGIVEGTNGDTKYQYADGTYATNTFETVDGKTYYFDQNGNAVKGIHAVGNQKYYFNNKGHMETGWKNVNGNDYYFTPSNGSMVKGLQTINNKLYHFGTDGIMDKGMVKTTSGKIYEFGTDGARVENKGWKTINNQKYYFTDNFNAQTGKKTIDGKTYLFNEDGVMSTGWQNLDQKDYYFGKDGVMAVGLRTIEGKVYSFSDNGIMQKGLIKAADGKIYQFGSNGARADNKGWKVIDGKRYYFNKDHSAATGKQTIDGKAYTFASNGVLITSVETGWIKQGNTWIYRDLNGEKVTGLQKLSSDGEEDYYYFDKNGNMQKGWQKIEGPAGKGWYYFNTSGKIKRNWMQLNGTWYFLGNDARMKTGWIEDQGKKYFMETDGSMLTSQWKKVDGSWYYLDSAGEMASGWKMLPTSNGSSEKAHYYFGTDGAMLTNTTTPDGFRVDSAGVWIQ